MLIIVNGVTYHTKQEIRFHEFQ